MARLNGSTGYYLSLSEALALARTDAYRGCTLTILRSSTDPISVNSGSFTLTAAQDVMLGGKVTLGKKANVTLSGGSYAKLRQHLRAQPHRRRHLLRCRGSCGTAPPSPAAASSAPSPSPTPSPSPAVPSPVMSPSTMAASWSPAPAPSAASPSSPAEAALSPGGHFGEITQSNGSLCAALLAEGYAYSDGGIINGYVPIVGGVDVVPHAQHQYVWLNQKLLCGCGHVADEDADAPVITGITDGETYYGDGDLHRHRRP